MIRMVAVSCEKLFIEVVSQSGHDAIGKGRHSIGMGFPRSKTGERDRGFLVSLLSSAHHQLRTQKISREQHSRYSHYNQNGSGAISFTGFGPYRPIFGTERNWPGIQATGLARANVIETEERAN